MTRSGRSETWHPPADDIDRIERALGWRPTQFRPAATDRGATATAARWIATDGDAASAAVRSAFVKIGATELTADWLRTEHHNYGTLRGLFLPEVLGFDDDGRRPVLALEDLSAADWPPPWSDSHVAAVLDALTAIHATPPPAHLTPVELEVDRDWPDIGAHPADMVALGLCSPAWLEGALPALSAAAATAPLAGDRLIHLDIRSDNVCIRDGRAIVIDWNHAALANPDLDLAFWLPSLRAEGGPPPETILQNAPELAALVAGFFCAGARRPPIPEAPHVRPLQLAQARAALPWAARALGLPPP